jgi:hypothetical protein
MVWPFLCEVQTKLSVTIIPIHFVGIDNGDL